MRALSGLWQGTAGSQQTEGLPTHFYSQLKALDLPGLTSTGTHRCACGQVRKADAVLYYVGKQEKIILEGKETCLKVMATMSALTLKIPHNLSHRNNYRVFFLL